jgi:hypothetical protein
MERTCSLSQPIDFDLLYVVVIVRLAHSVHFSNGYVTIPVFALMRSLPDCQSSARLMIGTILSIQSGETPAGT